MLVARQKKLENYRSYERNYERHNKKNVNRFKLKKDRLVKIFGCIFVLIHAAVAILLVNHYNQITQLNKEIIYYEQKLGELHVKQDHLKIEIANLKTLERIEGIAINELGMYYPNEDKRPELVATN